MLERVCILIIMNKLKREKRVAILRALVEGCSMRSTSRMIGCSINSVTRLLVLAGKAAERHQHEIMQNLTCERLQIDEIWSFCGSKQKNVPEELKDVWGHGDVWTWTAIDAETKLVPAWHVGWRNAEDAEEFIADLASRLANRPQLTTDGLKVYIKAVKDAFGGDIDYAMLRKVYGSSQEAEKRYSPAVCTGVEHDVVSGAPDPEHISTSFVERQNLTMRMCMRRFTRLTNAFSKKIQNHEHAIALHFWHYNLSRPHKTLRCTPAMAAGVTDRLWDLGDLVDLIDEDDKNSN